MVWYTVTATGQAEVEAEEKDVTVEVPLLLLVLILLVLVLLVAEEKEEGGRGEMLLVVGETMLELLVKGMLLLLIGEVLLGGDREVAEDVVPLPVPGALVEEEAAVLVGGATMLELLLLGGMMLLLEGNGGNDDDDDGPAVAEDEAVLLGNRVLLLDSALPVGTLPVDEAVVPLEEDTGDDDGGGREEVPVDEAVVFTKGELVAVPLLVGTLPVGEEEEEAAEVPLDDTEDVGMPAVDEAVLLTRPVELDGPLVVEGPTVDDVALAREELGADDDGEVPFEDADEVGRVAVDEAATPLVEGPTVEDVPLAREELAGVDDSGLVEAVEEVGVTVPLPEGELVGPLAPVEEAVLLREPVLEDTALPDGAVDDD